MTVVNLKIPALAVDQLGEAYMAIRWFTDETKKAYVARPAEHANDLVYLHPDKSIPRGTKLTVRSDECVLFFREGEFVGRINPGTVLLDTANIPFLGHLVVDKFTDANHFLCELFFVSMRETIFDIPWAPDIPWASEDPRSAERPRSPDSSGQLDSRWSPLGQYKDKNSANVVSINGRLSYTVRVSDPAKLVMELGGQRTASGAVIREILNGRVLNQVRRVVGSRTQHLPALDVVSNADAEAMSEELKQLAHNEFNPLGMGIGRIFNFALSLDSDSLQLLRDYGKQEGGMKLASSEGFAEFNIVQGQRAALEGLGKGLGTGNGPVVMSGMNFGGNLTGSRRPPFRTAPGRPGTVLGAQASFHLRTENGEIGPLSARQLALLAISKGIKLSDMVIRGSEDPDDVAFAAELEPQIVAEYKRRIPGGGAKAPNGGTQAFDLAFSGAIEDGKITGAEFSMLANLAVALGLDRDVQTGEARVQFMAQSNNIPITE